MRELFSFYICMYVLLANTCGSMIYSLGKLQSWQGLRRDRDMLRLSKQYNFTFRLIHVLIFFTRDYQNTLFTSKLP